MKSAMAIASIMVLIGFLSSIQFANAESRAFTVSSGSMEPALKVNDVVRTDESFPFDQLVNGDIIVFKKPGTDDNYVIARVVEIQVQSGERILRTKGDANAESTPGIDYPIKQENYVGRVTDVIPGIGVYQKVLSPPLSYLIGIGILGGIGYGVYRWRKKKRKTT